MKSNKEKVELHRALITFIKSGSANGREDMRGKCLRFVAKHFKPDNAPDHSQPIATSTTRIQDGHHRASALKKIGCARML